MYNLTPLSHACLRRGQLTCTSSRAPWPCFGDPGLHPQHPSLHTEAALPKFPGLPQPDTKEVSTCLLNE